MGRFNRNIENSGRIIKNLIQELPTSRHTRPPRIKDWISPNNLALLIGASRCSKDITYTIKQAINTYIKAFIGSYIKIAHMQLSG